MSRVLRMIILSIPTMYEWLLHSGDVHLPSYSILSAALASVMSGLHEADSESLAGVTLFVLAKMLLKQSLLENSRISEKIFWHQSTFPI